MNTADMQCLLKALVPTSHRYHRKALLRLPQACPACLEDHNARAPLAAFLRSFNDGWGNVDMDLLMPELAMALDPRFGEGPGPLWEIINGEL